MKLSQHVLSAAVTAALIGGASMPASAGVIATSTFAMGGSATVTGFADGDSKTFTIDLFDMAGGASIAAPSTNLFEALEVSGVLAVDFQQNGVLGGPTAFALPIPPTNVFSGMMDFTGLLASSYAFGFAPGTMGSHAGSGAGVPIAFGIEYDGMTPALPLINALFGTSFVDPAGSGKLAVTGLAYADGLLLNFTEYDLDWVGFGALLAAADSVYGPGTPDSTTVDFRMDMTVKAIPEPASLALLGIGIAGLGLMRRRKA